MLTMKIKQLSAIPIGIVLLGIDIMMRRYFHVNNLEDFIQGLLIGLSIALNLRYVFNHSRKIVCS